MYEVELKVRADHEELRALLAETDASERETVTQRDTYYDAPHRDFALTDEALRIRRETTASDASVQTVLTYKGPLVDESSKTREEVETPLASVEAVESILTALGFEPAATVEKERVRFDLDEFTVTLDSIEELGQFLEVETTVEAPEPPSESTDADPPEAVREARARAFDILESLELDPDRQIRTSYLGLLLEES